MRFGVGADQPGRRHLPDARDRRRVGRVQRRRPRPEHRVRPDGDPRPCRRTALGRRRPVRRGLSWKAWAADLDEHLDRIEQLMWPNLMILGGGVSKNADRFIPRLTVRCPVVAGRRCATTRGSSARRSSRPRAACRRPPGTARRPVRRLTGPAGHGPRWRPPGTPAYHRGPIPPPSRTAPMTTETRADVPDRARWSSAASPSMPPTARRSTSSTRPTAPVIATAPLGGREDVDRAVAAAQAAFEDRKGWATLGRRQARPLAGQARRADQGAQRGAGPAREPQRRQADHRRARRDHRRQPRLRLLRRRRQQDLRPDDPGVEARARPDAARADRRRRADRAVELPAADGLVEGRAGAGRRQHRDPQARAATPR